MNPAKTLRLLLLEGSAEISIGKAIERDLLPVTLPRSLLSSKGFSEERTTRITEVRRETTDDE